MAHLLITIIAAHRMAVSAIAAILLKQEGFIASYTILSSDLAHVISSERPRSGTG